MHPLSTRNEFLRLRVNGLSLAAIGRRLGVSKPTLIAWNRQSQAELQSHRADDHHRVTQELAASVSQQLADATHRLAALKQELFSRAIRHTPTPVLETLAGELRQKIQNLEALRAPQPPTPNAHP